MTLLHQAAQKAVEAALRRAFSLGQTYWQQADSESFSQHRKADITADEFESLVDETLSALQQQPEPVAEVLSWTNSSYSRNYKLRWLKDVPEGTKLYTAPPALQQQEVPREPVAEWLGDLEADISAIDCRYRGDPSYDHDAYWMKDRVMAVIERHRGQLAASPSTTQQQEAPR